MNDVKNEVLNVNTGKIEFGFAPLAEKMSTSALHKNIADGNVVQRQYGDFSVYKYSDDTQYNWAWNEVTLRTRGLIVYNDTQTIVARGYNKFFNYGQLERFNINIPDDENVFIMDKLDGSLGIAFKWNDKWIVSTAGSINSEQAIWATKLMNDKYSHIAYTEGMTIMVEIIYPENRIVTNYNGLSDIVLLGATDNNGHWISPHDISWDGMVTSTKNGSVREVLNARDPEDGTEGFVARTTSGLLFKVKFPHYLELHRIKFSISRKMVWEHIFNDTYAEFAASIPDEFSDEVKSFHAEIMSNYANIEAEVNEFAQNIPLGDRGDRARWINSQNVPNYLKSLAMTKFIAGNDIRQGILKAIKPKGNVN